MKPTNLLLQDKLALFILITLIINALSCKNKIGAPTYTAQKTAIGEQAALVSPHPLATEAGLKVLRQGGNAVDAAIAVQFAMAVVYPRAGNLGGGGFMVIRQPEGEVHALDYREKAPSQAHKNMYLDSTGQVIDGLSRSGALAVGVPGTVAGMEAAFEKYSALKDWSALLQPAIDYAAQGFQLSQAEAERLNRFQEEFLAHNEPGIPFIKNHFERGDWFRQPELASTLRAIRDQGAIGFYKGKVAQAIAATMDEKDGLITTADLAAYEAVWRVPTASRYKGYTVWSMPPPSSGGVALSQMLEMVEPYAIGEMGFHHTAAVHLMVEAERRAFADRAQHLGDLDFYDVPMEKLMDSLYLASRMADFTPDTATASGQLAAGNFTLVKESFETTHTSVVSPEGQAVSVTTTLNSNYGSKVFVREGGFFLNNEMDDFSAKPGVPNQFGLVGAEANAIAPGKRMLSSMTPTIVEKDGELFLVLGAPGGSTIITAVFQVFLNVAEFGMPLPEAINAGRFHHQWLPDQILLEKGGLPDSVQQALKAMGHEIREIDRMAVIKAVLKDEEGRLHAAGDPRNPDDDARAY
ncbi:gamma-glutamyltransferase [Phaeodactylibacter luteus]|uniref:Glutathione hydrolase proenzyme n=1 Tax=Phaeodactylibacter luteus TaxID=1564516 RepID=A0A5C6RRD6_9BACT|nr:gamma-glutamyltransferase [Phaeodactylibacter luteus]TXB64911.1 gamma-glutamyltransferase [Phaeodactylibacter luteus]